MVPLLSFRGQQFPLASSTIPFFRKRLLADDLFLQDANLHRKYRQLAEAGMPGTSRADTH
jgi:hypothetical protein